MRKILGILALITAVVVAVIIALTQQSEAMQRCAQEDGSTQDVCVWSYTTPQGESRTLVNHNYGEWTYYPHTGAYITWDSAPTSADVIAAAK